MLKIGKIPDNVLRRSVLKQIKSRRSEVIKRAAAGSDFSAIQVDDNTIITAVNTFALTEGMSADYAVYSAVNNVAVSGAKPIEIMVSIMIPESASEEALKAIVADVERACGELDIELTGGHTEISKAVSCAVVSVTAVGKAGDRLIDSAAGQSGDDIVMTKCIGLAGTAVLAIRHEKELKQRFSPAFVDKAIDFNRQLSIVKEAGIAAGLNVHAMHDVSKGGIFGALWELGEASSKGMEIDLMSIDIRQETVEICEELGVNPYEMLSEGALLITTNDGTGLVRELAKVGIDSNIIGKLTDSNDRVVINADERRFLYRPVGDSLDMTE